MNPDQNILTVTEVEKEIWAQTKTDVKTNYNSRNIQKGLSAQWLLRLKKWGRRRSFGVPLMEKRGKVGEEKGGK